MLNLRTTSLAIGYILLISSIIIEITLFCYLKDAIAYLPHEDVPIYIGGLVAIIINTVNTIILLVGLHMYKRWWVKAFLIMECALYVISLTALIVLGQVGFGVIPSTACFVGIMTPVERYCSQMNNAPNMNRPVGYNTLHYIEI